MLPSRPMRRPLAIAMMGALFVPFLHVAATPAAPLKIVATLPILKEFTEQVGREHVEVRTLITGLESEHSYSPKPSDLKALGEARLLLEIGLGLEVWVGGLVKNASNPALRVVTTSEGVGLIRDHAPNAASAGNPHIWLDPENAKVMVRHIADALIAADPAHKDAYLTNLADYLRRLDQVQTNLLERVASLQDRRIVTHHPAWPYFARRFGFQIEGDIIQQMGMEPSSAHLAEIAKRIKSRKIKVIVSEPQFNQKVVQALADETGARIVVLSPLPGTVKGTETYLALLSSNVTKLVAALQ
ncbi:MAG: zinc ABC transporter substrate-binding protein [Nitrospirae bacterium]|nr:MAG: zinc ABC transporter substrate-binding protein [Nitrospirota bacterium]